MAAWRVQIEFCLLQGIFLIFLFHDPEKGTLAWGGGRRLRWHNARLSKFRVTKKLGAAVKDRKRVVRVEAARARNTWFLVTQP